MLSVSYLGTMTRPITADLVNSLSLQAPVARKRQEHRVTLCSRDVLDNATQRLSYTCARRRQAKRSSASPKAALRACTGPDSADGVNHTFSAEHGGKLLHYSEATGSENKSITLRTHECGMYRQSSLAHPPPILSYRHATGRVNDRPKKKYQDRNSEPVGGSRRIVGYPRRLDRFSHLRGEGGQLRH